MNIRKLKPEEYEAGLSLIKEKAPWCEVPPPETLFGLFRGDKLEVVAGLRQVPWLEPIAGENLQSLKEMVIWLDGALSYLPEYICFCKSESSMDALIKREWKECVEGFAGTLWVRRRK